MAFAAHSVLREVQCCKGLPAGGSCRKAVQQGRLQSRSDRNVPSIMQRSSRKRRNVKLCSSSNDMASNENEFDLSQYLLAEIASVRPELSKYRNENKTKVEIPNWLVLLRLQETNNAIAVYVGQLEATGLIPDRDTRRQPRPLTYDLMKNTLTALGARVTKVCITALIDQTFHARLHCARQGVTDELVIDSRPSDALNLAIRYEAPIYINKAIADKMASPLASYESKEEVPSEVESMCREALKRYHDPTIVHKVNMQIAIEEDRFEDAAKIRNDIEHLLSGNRTFSLVVAMESALADKRWEECAFLCKELNKLIEAGDKGRP